MLIEFSVSNFLSFKSKATLSMIVTGITELEDKNTFETSDKTKLLKSAAIYGANASGKSNFLKAMVLMRHLVFNSAKEMQLVELLPVEGFRLSSETAGKPSSFEIVFDHENTIYRYGFEIDRNMVYAEWLYSSTKTKPTELFFRKKDKIKLSKKFKEGKGLESKTRANALFLSVVAQFNGEISNKVLKWFTNFNIISGIDDEAFRDFSIKKFKEDKNSILDFIQIADLGIEDIDVKETPISFENIPKHIPEDIKNLMMKSGNAMNIQTLTSHKKYDLDNKVIGFENFDMDRNESEGTKKIFCLSGPLLDTLRNGKILVVDELDTKLHPLITRALIKIFNSKKDNPNNAQIIFATHNTNLLTNEFLRRDQIWFVDKNSYGSSELFSFVEYKNENGDKIRKDESYEKNYLLGKYGAVPFIDLDLPIKKKSKK